MSDTRTAGFVGRHDELRTLDEVLRETHGGRPYIVLVDGEPGIGKTSLMREFLRRHPDVRQVWVSGDETEAQLEFGVADQLLHATGAAASPGTHRDSFAVGAELLALLGTLEEQGTVVVVIDDLHWTDPASGRALLFWLRRLRGDSVLVLLAARSHTLDRLGESWLRLLADPGRASRLALTGLTPAEVGELAAAAGHQLPASAGERLRAHTGGNPLYVVALLAELTPEVLLDRDAALPAPHSYAATVLARSARLPAPARAVLTAAAVIGTHASVGTASRVADVRLPPPDLDRLMGSGLVAWRTGGGPDEIAFTHPLIRAAVYDDLSPARRRELHRRAAAAVPENAARLAHRVAAAGGPDAELAGQLAISADTELRAGHPLAAADHLLWSARLGAGTGAGETALLEAVELLLIGGDVATALSYADAVHRCVAGPHRRFVLAAIAAAVGELTAAAAELQAVAEEAPDAVLFGRSAASLALVLTVLGRHAAAIRWARRALDVAGDVVTVDLIARQSLAVALAKTGHGTEALALLPTDVAATAHPSRFDAELLIARTDVQLWSGNAPAAVADGRTVVRWAHAGTPPNHLANCYVSLAEAEQHAGWWDEAVGHVELAGSLILDTDHIWYGPRAHAVATTLYACRGAWADATAHLQATAQAAVMAPFPESRAHLCLAEAGLAWARRDWQGVLAAVEPLRHPGDEPLPADDASVAGWRLRCVEALLVLGDVATAGALLAQADRLDSGRAWAATRARLRAAWQLARGDRSAALAGYANAAADEQTARTPFEHALLLLDHGRLLLDADRPAPAARTLERARDMLWRLRAAPFVATADAALERCGVLPPALTAVGELDGLTRREQVVVRLVADGMTNREVATQLYVSAKTVEYHLAHVFRKLGIRSRRQLRQLVTTASADQR